MRATTGDATRDAVRPAAGGTPGPARDRIVRPVLPEGGAFGVWLSHDVDRVRKSLLHAVYYAWRQRRARHLLDTLPGRNPYWNFYRIMELEAKHGARSTFFMLHETLRPNPLQPRSFALAMGRYSLRDPRIRRAVRDIAAAGWDVGLHGSYRSFTDRGLLRQEKAILEDALGRPVRGVRQHYLNLRVPETWEHQRAVGFGYDASFGLTERVGFRDDIFWPFRPFDDAFTVIPLVMMDVYLLREAGNVAGAERSIDRVIELCREKGAVLSALWHHRTLNPAEFPELHHLYEYLLRAAVASGARFVLPDDVLAPQPPTATGA